MEDLMSLYGNALLRGFIVSIVTGLAFAVLRSFIRNVKLLILVLFLGWLIFMGIIPNPITLFKLK